MPQYLSAICVSYHSLVLTAATLRLPATATPKIHSTKYRMVPNPADTNLEFVFYPATSNLQPANRHRGTHFRPFHLISFSELAIPTGERCLQFFHTLAHTHTHTAGKCGRRRDGQIFVNDTGALRCSALLGDFFFRSHLVV